MCRKKLISCSCRGTPLARCDVKKQRYDDSAAYKHVPTVMVSVTGYIPPTQPQGLHNKGCSFYTTGEFLLIEP